MNNQKPKPQKPDLPVATNAPTKRSIEFMSVKSKDGVSEPSIKLDIGDKESEFVEYEVNEQEWVTIFNDLLHDHVQDVLGVVRSGITHF